MTSEDQIAFLRARHAELEDALTKEEERPLPDDAKLAELKKRKLQIKDELAKLEVSSA